MYTVFIDFGNDKSFETLTLKVNLTDKLNSTISEKSIALSNFSIYYTQKIIKSSYSNNAFKVVVKSSNDKFGFPDQPCFLSGIQDYFNYILKSSDKILIIYQSKYTSIK